MSEHDNEFRSKVGHRPTFFVPDTGSPGGSAVLIGPDGAESPVLEAPVLSPPSDTRPDGSPWEATFDKRVGFRVPFAFVSEGVHALVITQDDVVTTYTIHVDAADANHKKL